MRKYSGIIVLLTIAVFSISFMLKTSEEDNASRIRTWYITECKSFEKESRSFEMAIATDNPKKIQEQFFKLRRSYKRIEIFVEYFFPFYAGRLNGPPIPFFEEMEADMGMQLPKGMQLIESYIFPDLNPDTKNILVTEAKTLSRYAAELIEVNESDAFDLNNITDAIIEQLYRLAALTVTGFDSAVALN